MEITKRLITNSANFTKGRDGWTGNPFIVLHTYNGAGTSCYNWFQNNTDEVSSTFAVFIENNELKIEQYVDWGDTPHANGNWWANVNSFTIEVQDNGQPYAERDARLYDGAAWLCSEIIKRYPQIVPNSSGIKKHSDFPPTGCPGGLKVDLIIQKTAEILNPPLPDWRKNLVKIDPAKTYKPKNSFSLYEIATNTALHTYEPNTELTVTYQKDNWRYTEYSVTNNFNRAFKLEEIETPEPPTPEPTPKPEPEKAYKVIVSEDEQIIKEYEYDTLEQAQEKYEICKLSLTLGQDVAIYENNILIDSFFYIMGNTTKTIGEHLKSTTQIAVPVQTVTTFIGVILAYHHPELTFEVLIAYCGLIGIGINILYILAIKLLEKF